MDIQKRRTFIISFIYFGIIGLLCYIVFKKLVPMLAPFIAALVIAALLEPGVSALSAHIRGGRPRAAFIVLVTFYSCIISIAVFSGSRIFRIFQEQAKKLPGFYSQALEPGVSRLLFLLENSFPAHSIHISSIGESLEHFMENAALTLSSIFLDRGASLIGSFPSLVLDLFITVIASFFLTGRYREILDFLLSQLPEDKRFLLLSMCASAREVTGRLVRAYALLMLITFAELYAGFFVLGIPARFTAACMTALVDILPVLGTGTILLPWAFTAWTAGSGSLALGLVCLYLLILAVRQIMEPRIIGLQMGLPPAAALLCMFVGGKLFGLTGMFLFPIAATVLKELHDRDIFHIQEYL